MDKGQIELVLEALNAIDRIASDSKSSGLASAVTLIRVITGTVADVLSGKRDPIDGKAELKRLMDNLVVNDDKADAIVKKRFSDPE